MTKKLQLIILTGFVAAFGFLVFSTVNAAAVTINRFDLSPRTVLTTTGGQTRFQMILAGTINVPEFNSTCGANHNEFAWYVYAGAGVRKASGKYTVVRTSNPQPFSIQQNITVDVSASEQRGGTFNYYASIYCSTGVFSSKLTESSKVPITFGTSSTADKVWACIAANNKYACSPANLQNLSDVPVCAGRTPLQIGKNLCGLDAGTGGSSGGGPGSGGSGGQPGQPVVINIPNLVQAESLIDLAKAIGRFIFQIAIPIAVIVIIYAGILFLTSGGDKEKVTKARKALWYAVIGLAIILIGQGFFTLIKSILNLGAGS